MQKKCVTMARHSVEIVFKNTQEYFFEEMCFVFVQVKKRRANDKVCLRIEKKNTCDGSLH